MKLFALLSLLTALCLTVRGHNGTSWFDSKHNATCIGNDDGHISCKHGHRHGGDPEFSRPDPNSKRASSVAIRGREVSPLEKRLTCNLDSVAHGLACFTHCFALNYCNSHCNADNICICDCYDESPWYELPCSKTTCA